MGVGFSWNRDPRPEQDNTRVPVHRVLDLKSDEVVRGVKDFPDLFMGPKKKNYIDFQAMRLAKLRGTTALYWVMSDHHERNAADFSPYEAPDFLEDDDFFVIDDDFQVTGNVNLYGEPVEVGEIFDQQKRTVEESWKLEGDPKIVRGLVQETEDEEEVHEEGTIVIRRLRFDLPRKMCEELGFRPWYSDVIRFTLETVTGVDFDGYYQVERVERTEARHGSTGFFGYYKLTCVRSSRWPAERMGIKEPIPYDVPDLRGNSGERILPGEDSDC